LASAAATGQAAGGEFASSMAEAPAEPPKPKAVFGSRTRRTRRAL